VRKIRACFTYIAQALRSTSVTRTETTIDPTIPSPFEKKKNMRQPPSSITAAAARVFRRWRQMLADAPVSCFRIL
jgi:hypothetical protein